MTTTTRFKRSLAVLATALIGVSASAYAEDKPNILVIWGDDIGQSNVSAYTFWFNGLQDA